jgi:hypothetical protein
MTLRAFQAQSDSLVLLVNKPCTRVARGHGRTLMLDFGEFGQPDARGYRQPSLSLVIECPWRLEDAYRSIAGSADTSERIKERTAVLVGHSIVRTEVILPGYMVKLYFDDGHLLWIFPDDSKHYTEVSDDPHVSWYVAGRLADDGWEQDATLPAEAAREDV